MWREWVARATVRQEELHLVLIEDLSPEAGSEEHACELTVNRHHLSRNRERIATATFSDLAQAQDYCRKEYGVASGDWMHEITLPRLFQFNYTVSNCGVPQPRPITSPNAKIVFRFSPVSPLDDENGCTHTVLNICGTREGLEYLAAMLVLCADSDKYDPQFHFHLDNQREVETDIDVTIRAPVYLDMLRSGEFREFRSPWIIVPPDGAAEDSNE